MAAFNDLFGDGFDFNKLIAYPERFASRDADRKLLSHDEMIAKYGSWEDGYNTGGYDWCISNWGTKWNAYQVVRRDYGQMCITFQTAWGPPRQIIHALHERFPKLSISLEYFEMGMGFCGGMTFYYREYDGTCDADEWHSDEYRGRRGG